MRDPEMNRSNTQPVFLEGVFIREGTADSPDIPQMLFLVIVSWWTRPQWIAVQWRSWFIGSSNSAFFSTLNSNCVSTFALRFLLVLENWRFWRDHQGPLRMGHA